MISFREETTKYYCKPQFHEKASFHIDYFLDSCFRRNDRGKRISVGGEKRRPSIIRGTCRFDSKIRGVLEVTDFVSACGERSKNFFRKIEISQNLPSFFAEKWANFGD